MRIIRMSGWVLAAAAVLTSGCGPEPVLFGEASEVQVAVDPSLFLAPSLLEPVVQEERELADGRRVLCYVFRTRSVPHEHAMGPWSPRNVTDGPEAGGLWMKDGEIYDVDGPFIVGLAELYGDPQWRLYRDDGTVKVTLTREAAEGAARPDVDPRFRNHAVECDPAWYGDQVTTFVIPVMPRLADGPTRPRRGGVGVAFNGVNYDPPAPLHAITAAHTIAPLDDSGGHVNPHAGYHYHAATGATHEVPQADGHAPMIGYALDGFGIYAHLDTAGGPPAPLDDCGGHVDAVRGYHYHASLPGGNAIIGSFRGTPGTMSVGHEE